MHDVRTGPATVRAADGTRIAMTLDGTGPALVLVEPAGHSSQFSAFDGLVPLLRPDFTVVSYDRRGRGASTDTAPYAVEREVEDLAAVLDAVGGPIDVLGMSSGALLAVQAVVHGLPVRRLALVEPPLDDDVAAQAAFTTDLRTRLERDGNEAGLERFLGSILPPELLDGMRGSVAWEAMAAIAPTLVHDCLVSEATGTATLAKIDVPTLVVDSHGSSDDLAAMAARAAGSIPGATHRTLPGGWHGVDDDALASALQSFLLADDGSTPARMSDVGPPLSPG